jgi:hypothetical protein
MLRGPNLWQLNPDAITMMVTGALQVTGALALFTLSCHPTHLLPTVPSVMLAYYGWVFRHYKKR